jgi:cation transport ATPase
MADPDVRLGEPKVRADASRGDAAAALFVAIDGQSAGVVYPVFGTLLSPMVAALAMSVSLVSVIASALRRHRAAL